MAYQLVGKSIVDVEMSNYQCYTVDKGIDSSGTANFIVEGHPDYFIDLSKCYLKTTFRIVDDKGDVLDDTATAFPCENYGTNLWSQVNVSLNNTPLPPGNDYAYTAQITSLVGASPESRGMVLKDLAGWQQPLNGSSKLEHSLAGTYKTIKAATKQSYPLIVYDRIYSDFFLSCPQLLPNNMQLGITFTRSKDAFVLGRDNGDTKAYRIQVGSVSLFIKRVQLNETAHKLVDQNLATGGKLRYQRLQTVALPCAKGSRSWNWHNCFSSDVPKRVFMALVSQESYFGSFDRTSSFLESAGVSSVRFCLDGRDIMPEPYKSDFHYDESGIVESAKCNAKSPYAGLCNTIGIFSNLRQYQGIHYDKYVNGSTVFAVELGRKYPTIGSFDVHMEFATPTTDALMIILVGEFERVISFDRNRNIV